MSSTGAQGNERASSPAISSDGRYVAFSSDASNLVPGDTNGSPDVFVRDRKLGTTRRVSVSSTETQGNGGSFGAGDQSGWPVRGLRLGGVESGAR